MMPICGYKESTGPRCEAVAEENIGTIVLPGRTDGYGNPWEQTHYLCVKHQAQLLKNLGFDYASE
jgi:hypothetical protein